MVDLKKLREKNLKLTKKKIRESINEDNYIIHAVNNIDELVKVTGALSKRLRDWYAIYLPEFSGTVSSHEDFVRLVLSKKKNDLMKEMKIKETMGKDLDKKDLQPMFDLAKTIQGLYKEKDRLVQYLEQVMNKYCRNMFSLTGAVLGAKLIEEAGSLKNLALMPSTTVQLLGAEKALFRHLKTGARPPKHGYIVNHPMVSSAKKTLRGKYARVLADKITIAVRADYFKGKFIGDKLQKELEAKLK